MINSTKREFFMLINVTMPTNYCWYFYIYEHDKDTTSLKAGPGIVYTVQHSGKFHAQLNWA